MPSFAMGGKFIVYCCENGRPVWREEFANGVVDEALNAVLDIMFRSTTQIANWYIAPLTLASGGAVAASDTMASHTGWTESTAYDEGARPDWSPPAASGKLLKNTSSVDFTMNESTLVDGFLLASDNTKGGTTGTLWATGLFASQRSLSAGQQLRAFYELGAIAVA